MGFLVQSKFPNFSLFVFAIRVWRQTTSQQIYLLVTALAYLDILPEESGFTSQSLPSAGTLEKQKI